MKRTQAMKLIGGSCLALLLTVSIAYGENILGITATVVSIDQKAMSMTLSDTSVDAKEAKQYAAFWDKETTFVKSKRSGPLMFDEKPIKPDAVKKGATVRAEMTDRGQKGGKLWLNKVNLKE